MKLINHLLDYSKHWERPNIYAFTGNSTIKNNGAIVMGRGAAKQCRDLFPGIDKQFGDALTEIPNAHLLYAWITPAQWLIWFKVKDHWANPAKLEIIEESTRQLKEIALIKTSYIIHMNYPGIGNGQLLEHEVGHIIHHLPDNVWIYK